MTGLHALHMIIGLAVMAVMLWLSWRGTITAGARAHRGSSGHHAGTSSASVWIFSFPLLYLIGRHV